MDSENKEIISLMIPYARLISRKFIVSLLGLVFSISLPVVCSAENSGVGFVLITSIMRSKVDHDGGLSLFCGNEFSTTAEEDPQWRADLYSINLSQNGNRLQVWTKINESNGCQPETTEDLIARHPCITSALESAIEQSTEIAVELEQGYSSAIQDQEYLGNISPEDLYYKLIIQSSDRSLRFIDPYGWDFSWLSNWNPFISSENSCPFHFEFRHGARMANGAEKIIQTYPIKAQ